MKKLSKIKIGITLVILLIVAISLIYLFSSNNEKIIEIGSIGILTGEGASWGTAAKNGIDMAVEKINAEGGINGKKLIVNHQDDNSDPKKAVSAFQYLTSVKGIKIIIGPTWSHTGLAILPLILEKEVLVISPSLGVKEFNEASDYIFNTWPHDEILSTNLAELVYKKGHRKVIIIGAEQVWVKDQTKAFTKRFEELGGQVTLTLEPNPAEKTPYTEALKIKEKEDDIDAIVSTTDGILVGVLIAKRIRELGVKLPIYSISLDQATIDASEGAYENLEFLTSLTPDPEFKKEYEEKYNIPLEIGADSAYDAVMLIAQAMKETKSEDPKVLQEYLNKVENYNGISGNLTSDEKGGFTKPFVLNKIVNGKPVDIDY